MDSKDFIKAAILLFLYVGVAPLLGFVLRGRRKLQRIAFGLMCFMTISGLLAPTEWGLTLGFVDFRGHARGYPFFFNEILALALLLGGIFEPKTRVKLLPPGLWLYLLYCTLSLVSIVNAVSANYTLMAAFKAYKVILIFLAAYNFIRAEDDIRFFLSTMTWTVLWELIVVLKMKYVDHIYQVWGTFEHQNALSMYATMIGLVLLAAGAGPKNPRSNFFLFGFLCSAVIVECTLSRGGLVMFVMGTGVVLLLSLAEKITARRLMVVSSLTVILLAVGAISFKTVVSRFNDRYNADSKQTRDMLNEASRKMLSDYKLGVGWNNYAVMINHPYHYGDIIDDYFRKYNETVDPKAAKGIVESHYYLLLSETGYQGYISYLLVIGVFLWWNIRGAWFFRQEFLGPVSYGIFMGCTMNYAQSTLERVLTQPRNMMLWMLLLAIGSKIESWRRQARASGLTSAKSARAGEEVRRGTRSSGRAQATVAGRG